MQQVAGAAGKVALLREQVQALDGQEIGPDGKPDPVVEMYNSERDRLVRISKTAIDAGVFERRLLLEQDKVKGKKSGIFPLEGMAPAGHL